MKQQETLQQAATPSSRELERIQDIFSKLDFPDTFSSRALYNPAERIRTANEVLEAIMPVYESVDGLKGILPPPPAPLDLASPDRPQPAATKKQRKRTIRRAEKLLAIANNRHLKTILAWFKLVVELACPIFAPVFTAIEALEKTLEYSRPKPKK